MWKAGQSETLCVKKSWLGDRMHEGYTIRGAGQPVSPLLKYKVSRNSTCTRAYTGVHTGTHV